MAEDKYECKYKMVFEADSNATVINDAHFDIKGDFNTCGFDTKDFLNSQQKEDIEIPSVQQKIDEAIKKFASKLRGNQSLKWAHLYNALIEKYKIPYMTAKEFGEYVHERVDISFETIRKSGDYRKTKQEDRRAIEMIKGQI